MTLLAEEEGMTPSYCAYLAKVQQRQCQDSRRQLTHARGWLQVMMCAPRSSIGQPDTASLLQGQGYLYAAVQASQQCYAGNTISRCAAACPGNGYQACRCRAVNTWHQRRRLAG
jgi:hypothetical protein